MTRPRTRLALAIAATAAAAFALAGCAGTASTSPTASAGAVAQIGFPVTIDSALGSTTIEAAPTRIATWGWGATDAVLALGIVPVAIPADNYSGGDDKMSPWISDAIEQLGGDAPTILDSSASEISVEELLATDPDVLLAPYSGLTQKEFDAVTAAGVPVIAYPEAAWTTPWRDVITITGEALGMKDQAAQLLGDLDTLVSDAAASHPEFAGTSIAYIDDDVDTFYMYLPADPRVEILEDLGFVTPSSVTALDNKEGTFYTTVSYESLDRIDAQVIFTQAEEQSALDEFLSSDRGLLIPAVKKGAVAAIVGAENVGAVSPTALSLPWLLPTMTDKLAAAVATAKS
ncbi:ABC transporter substrate-binding protein [Microbacterium rhizomatis]|uniref:ABC transporter substrate-binding protein n=1 Tax=Microbacterium rhizomatis TaxID=1631477 RepID=A0A5J5J5Y4_9MICO|nr:ABC transporter substrate-binding protein [Microbacterium rhizomatis]KAA9110839.1 ABC transporter substrate-binding protein [Microbacterium rhizomatis]